MKKNIWIWNHYATNMFFDKAGRHYWFAEELIKRSYKPTIFCASTNHFSENDINTDRSSFLEKTTNEIPFVFIDTPAYKENSRKRIINMVSFYKNLFSVAKEYAKKNGKPDVILASSVHPLTLVAGIKIAKKFGVPCICEIRDLWPESIVAYGALKRRSLIAKLLYQGEKWIYKKSDSIIMTWEGGSQYILDQDWEEQIDLNKVKHISNGIIIKKFDKNSEENILTDADLDNGNYKNVVYAGSIRKVNDLGLLIDTAKLFKKRDKFNVKFLIYGSGDEQKYLKERCISENVNNVIFKGKVEKKYIPNILKKADINILHNSSTILDKYGQSQNKFFEYLAAGKPIIQTYRTGYSILDKCNCGVSVYKQEPKQIKEAILEIIDNEKESSTMGINARKAAYDYDFKVLTDKLIDIIEGL